MKQTVYFGSYTGKGWWGESESKGIYRSYLSGDGVLEEPKLVAETRSPSFVLISPTNVYSVSEHGDTEGGGEVCKLCLSVLRVTKGWERLGSSLTPTPSVPPHRFPLSQ